MAPAGTLIALVLGAAASLAQAQQDETATCGAAQYMPSEYTCYNNRTLCPVVFNMPTMPCEGSAGGCYGKERFSCEGGALKNLPPATEPFTLTAHGNRPTYKNMTVKACGGFLAVGANARQCTSCNNAGPNVTCSSYGNQAVLLPNGQMASDIPGGQYWYVNPSDGALMYVTGKDSPEVAWSGQNVTIYRNGFFDYENWPHYWVACLRLLPGGVPGTGRAWRIYTSTAINLEKDCEPIRLASTTVDRKQGAYKFD